MRPTSVLVALAMSGCVNVQASQRGKSRVYVGIVRVVMPDKTGAVAAIDVQTLGLGWDRGPFLGWHAGNWVVADPRECQLLIVIRSPAQADNAAKVLQSLEGQQPCLVDYTHRSRR